MTKYELSAPLASDDPEVMPTSMFEHLAFALGRMTGCMISEGTRLDIGGNGAVSLMCLQAVLSEAGHPDVVMGSAQSKDNHSSYIAMGDGSILSSEFVVGDGTLEARFYEPNDSDIAQQCGVLDFYHNAVNAAVAQVLAENNLLEPGDTMSGHVETDAHAAICRRVAGDGRVLIEAKAGGIRGGYDFVVDCPRPNSEFADVCKYVHLEEISPDEVRAEQAKHKSDMGITNPFPMKVGEA